MNATNPRIANWAGNQTFQPAQFHRPSSIDELRAIVARAPRIKAIGSRHAFNDMADSTELVSLDRMDPVIEIDAETRTVSTGAGIRYAELALALDAAGFALHNLASLPHITVGGAIATATHGSGDRSGNLATAVTAIELVTSDGDLVCASRGDKDFAGMVVNVGALGVVSRVTLEIEPAYQVAQSLFEHLSWETLFTHFDDVMSSADSVSLFVDFGPTVNQVWQKRRLDPAAPKPRESSFLGALAATTPLHP